MDAFGSTLKREREKRKFSLDDVSAATKISVRFLSAIESGRFDQLPGGIFNRGFVRAYARQLGLDEEQIVAQYKAAAGEDDPNTPVETDLPRGTQLALGPGHKELPWKELAVFLLLLAVGLSVWKFRSLEPARYRSQTTQIPAPIAVKLVPPTAVTEASPIHITPAPLGKPTEQHTANPGSQPFQLRIVAREDSWISVSGPGDEIFHQVLSPPEEKSFHSTSRIVVKAGNAGGLAFFWNGRELPVQGREGEVKTLIFDSAGIHQPPPAATP
jgi:transcriptional regulator with XRE-family HTH domain